MSMVSLPRRAMRAARIDLSGRHLLPSPVALVMATIVAVVISILADVLIVFAGTRLLHSAVGYAHFRFSDYATLTVIGVLIACAAWPIVIRASLDPRWLYLRLAVVVTLVLWLPDLYLVVRHQPGRDVVVLMTMHLAIAIVTYNAVVRIAHVGRDPLPVVEAASRVERVGPTRPAVEMQERTSGRSARRLAWGLVLFVGVEFVLGIVTLIYVPTGRSTGWLPNDGRTSYVAHAILGFPLALAAGVFFVRTRESTRIDRLSAWIGGIGVAVAGAGGLLTVAHPLRLVGLAVMLVGPVAAGFGYLLPALDRLSDGAKPPGDES